MSTGLIVLIVVVAIIIIALLVMLPRMRAAADRKKAERELHSRREAVAGEHREAAAQRESRAEQAEQKARMAQQAAERERAEANMQKERASMHERGMADDELIDESRARSLRCRQRHGYDPRRGHRPRRGHTRDVDGDGHTLDDRTRAATDRGDGTATTPADTTSPDYERGREDERFERHRVTDDVRESDRPRTS